MNVPANPFDTGEQNLTVRDIGEATVSSREQTEIQSAIVSAKRFPRNEADCFSKIIKCFQRISMAEASQYRFERGKKGVSGPSIDCARELARCWGNIRQGLRIVSMDDEWVHIKAFALDLETNTSVEGEDKFKKLIQRKNYSSGMTEWIKPDERDLRELINRRGAIIVRNCILQVIPKDVTEAAIAQANETMLQAADKTLKTNMEDTIRKLVVAFDALGVTVQMLEQKIGHDLKSLGKEEYVELRGIFKSLQDGHTNRGEHFDLGKVSADVTDELSAKLLKGGKDKK